MTRSFRQVHSLAAQLSAAIHREINAGRFVLVVGMFRASEEKVCIGCLWGVPHGGGVGFYDTMQLTMGFEDMVIEEYETTEAKGQIERNVINPFYRLGMELREIAIGNMSPSA